MITKNKQAAHAEPTNTITNANPCIFTTADRKRLKPLLSNESFDQLMKLVAGEPMPSPLFDSNGEEISYNEMDKIAIQSWHDGNEEYIYQIGKTVYAYYDDRSDFLVYVESHVTCVIEYSYPREDGYWEEKCVQFEVKAPLTPAKRSGSGSCRVWINTFYRDAYLQAGDLSRWAREENGDITVFESYSAARRWIYQDKKEHHGYADIVNPKGQYLYKHNEYAPRKYKICQ